MDKRRAWREQELQLVARWNAASERYREAQTEISRQHLSPGDGAPNADAVLRAETARAEIEAEVVPQRTVLRPKAVDDSGFEVRRDSKGEPDVHAAGVPLDRRIEKLLHLGEFDNLVELRQDLLFLHSKDGSVEENVFPSGQFRVESGANFQQARDSSS